METAAVTLIILLVVLAVIFVFRRDSKNETKFNNATQILAEIGTIRAQLGEITTLKLQLSTTNSQVTSIMTRMADVEKSLFSISQYFENRLKQEEVTSSNIQSIKDTLSGIGTKGKTGEHMVELALSKLPAEWIVHNLTVGNKTVEFGIKLPNGKVLPIDSKWIATEDLQGEEVSQDKLLEILRTRAREMKKYLDPMITYHMGIIAVPDSLNGIIPDIQSELMDENIAVIPYGFLLPYVLLVYNYCKGSKEIQADEVLKATTSLQDIVEGKLSKAIVMLTNSRDSIRGDVGKLITIVKE